MKSHIPQLTKNYCVTYPPYKQTGSLSFELNLDAICGCGKPYREHKEWQDWKKKNTKHPYTFGGTDELNNKTNGL